MTEHTIKPNKAEQEFRTKNQWYSFTSQTWGALGMATFFGALSTIAMGLVSIATKIPAFTEQGIPTASAALLGGPLPLIALGGLLAFGAFATYMSQRDATEVRVLQDEHMAQQHAKCIAPGKGIEQAAEYAQNCRADGKKWEATIAQGQPQVSRQLQ